MDVRLSRSLISDRKDPHDWNTWHHYETIHYKRIDEHPFIDRSRPHTLTFTEDEAARILLTGRVFCHRGIVLEVDKLLETRYIGGLRKVRGISYRYAAWIEGGHPVLRYHNIHLYDDDYHHRVFHPRTGEKVLYETLERYQFPTLSEVIDEVELVTRVLETSV